MKGLHGTLINMSIWKLFNKMKQVNVWSHPPILVQQIQQSHSPYYITVDAITDKKSGHKSHFYLVSTKFA